MNLGERMDNHIRITIVEKLYNTQFDNIGGLIDKKLKTKCNGIVTEQVTNINRNIYYNIFTLGGIMETNNGLTWI